MSLTLSRVVARYPGEDERPVLNDLSLDIGERGCVAVVGPTGSGKSSLGRVMIGLLKPVSGTVALDGKDIHQLESLAIARRQIGLLMQQPDNQLFGLTVGEDIRFGPLQAGLDEATCMQRMEEAMAGVGLDRQSFVARSPFSLSGGERRRVALAGLLAMEPLHLVLDEPIAGLDPVGRDEIERVIARMARRLSVVLLTADLPLALRLADRLVLLEGGAVQFDGPPAEGVARQGLIERLRLAVPPQVQLLASLQERGMNIDTGGDLRPPAVAEAVAHALQSAERGS